MSNIHSSNNAPQMEKTMATTAQLIQFIAAHGIHLNEGERYVGEILNDDGMPTHYLILLAGDKDYGTWKDAKAWAESIGGEMPTRQEQSLMFANAKKQFKRDWYWSCEEHQTDPSYAWFQYFGYGGQHYGHKSNDDIRARAVRRLVI